MAVSELVGDGTDDGSRFGTKVALDADGTTAAVTAHDQVNEQHKYYGTGALYIFEKSGGSWAQEAQFVPEDLGVEEIDDNVAVSGDGTTVISDITADDVGKVTVLEKSGGSWASQTELSPPVTDRQSRFANAITLSSDGRTAIITDTASVEIDSESQPGVAYVFEQSGGAWSHQDTLYDSGADTFGWSVSFSADDTTVVVGTLASAYVYTRSDGTWSQQAKLVPAAETGGDRTTTTVGMADDGSSVVIGARGQSDTWDSRDSEAASGRKPDIPGAAYVFDRSGDSWSQRGMLLGNEYGRGFGVSVAVGATTESILVGDRTQGTDSGDTGAAFIYEDA